MTIHAVAAVAILAAMPFSARGNDAPGRPSAEVPELTVLDHWAGRWDGESTWAADSDSPRGPKIRVDVIGEWVLEGRFLRQSWSIAEGQGVPKMSGSTLMTYEPTSRFYRSWSFASTGRVVEMKGVWEAASRTMTWTTLGPEGGPSSVTKSSFPDDATEAWTIVEKDGGKVVADLVGKNTRRKP